MLHRFPLALALLFLSSAAFAAFPSCPYTVSGSVRSLADIMGCQQSARNKFLSDYKVRHRRDAPIHIVDGLDTFQRAEVRGFLQKHPDQASLPDPEPEDDSGDDESLFSSVGDLFTKAADSFKEWFNSGGDKAGGDVADTANSAAVKKEAEQAAAFLNKAGVKTKGMNLQQIMTEAKKDPAKAVQGAVKGYNRQIDENLDDDMKIFWKKDK
jgi:hypothetical protein